MARTDVKKIDGKFKLWLEGVCNKDQRLRLKEKNDFYQAVWIYDEKIDALCSSYGMTIYIAFFGGYKIENNELQFFELDDEGNPIDDTPDYVFVPIELKETVFDGEWNKKFS